MCGEKNTDEVRQVEDYLRAHRIHNRLHQSRVIERVLECAALRHEADSRLDPVTLAAEETARIMQAWFASQIGDSARPPERLAAQDHGCGKDARRCVADAERLDGRSASGNAIVAQAGICKHRARCEVVDAGHVAGCVPDQVRAARTPHEQADALAAIEVAQHPVEDLADQERRIFTSRG